MTTITRYGGLVLPFILWLATTQAGQILPYTDCRAGLPWTAIFAAGAAATALASALFPLLRASRTRGRMEGFLAVLGPLIGLALSFAILLQAAAGLLVNPCLR